MPARVFHRYEDIKDVTSSVVCLGNFDGLHRGHEKIIKTALQFKASNAKAHNLESILFTFLPHPRIVLGFDLNLILSPEDRLALLKESGVDTVLQQNFDSEFQRMDADVFAREVLHSRLRAQAVVVGENFRFGFQARGDVNLLKNMNLFETICVPAEKEGDRAISSSWIREALRHQDVRLAANLLGRPFSTSGVVVKGDQRGRKIGFPTANLRVDPSLLIPRGVFLVSVSGAQFEDWPAVCNVGVRPSFEGVGAWIECHLLNFDADLYGQKLQVKFLDFIREEKKFSSIDELKHQIELDIKASETLQRDHETLHKRHS